MDPNNIEVEFVNDDAADNIDNDWQSSSSSHVGTIVEADTHPSPIETDYTMKRSRSDIPTGGDEDDDEPSAAARPLTRINSISKKTLMFSLAALAAIIFISVGAGYMSSSKSDDTTKVSTASMAAPWVEDTEGYAPYTTVTRQGPTSKGSKMMHGNIKEDNCSSGKSGKSNSTNSGGGKSGKSNSRRLRQQQQRRLSGKSGGKSNKKSSGCSTKSAKKSKAKSAKKSKGGSKGSKGRRL